MSNTILLRRGTAANLPDLQVGEPGFATDTKVLYVGAGAGTAEAAAFCTSTDIDAIQYEPNTFTQATITAALTAIGTTDKVTLLLRPGTWVISSNFDASAYTNVTFKLVPGALISHGAFTLGLPGIEAGPWQIFSGTGAITFSQEGNIERYLPQWWGVLGDGSTDNRTALRKAISDVSLSAGGEIWFGPGQYYHTGILHGDYVTLRGGNKESTKLIYSSATGNGIGASGAAADVTHFAIRGIYISNSGSTTGHAIKFDTSGVVRDFVLEDFYVTGAANGVYLGEAINCKIRKGRVVGQGRNVASSVGIQVGDNANSRTATTTEIDAYVTGFYTDILNDKCYGLKLNPAICENAVIALTNRAQTIGDLYVEGCAAFTFDTGSHAPVVGETIHGANSGATGVVSSVQLDSGTWDGTGAGSIVLTSIGIGSSGEWQVGENIADSGSNLIGVVVALGYSINDLSDDAGAPFGVNITPLNVPAGYWAAQKFAGTGGYKSIVNQLAYSSTYRGTSAQTVSTGSETDLIFNTSLGYEVHAPNITDGKVTIGKYGLCNIQVQATASSGTAGKIYKLRLYQNATLIGYNEVLIADNAFSVRLSTFATLLASVGDIIKATIEHDEGSDKNISIGQGLTSLSVISK